MNFVSPPNVSMKVIQEIEKTKLLTANQRFFHFIFISFVIAQVCYSIAIDFVNPQITPGLQFLRAFLRIIPNSLLVGVFHMHSKVDYNKNYKKSNILELILMAVALIYYIISDYFFFHDLIEKETPTRSEILLPAFSLGLESFWRFFIFYAIARKASFVIVYVIITLCSYVIIVFRYSGWLLGGRIFFQIAIMWCVIIYAERIKVNFFLENRKLKFQDKVHKVVLDSLPESTIVLTDEGKVKFINKYMTNIFGINNQRSFRASIENFATLKFRDYIEDEMLKTLSSRQGSALRGYQKPNIASIYGGQKDSVTLLIKEKIPVIDRGHTYNEMVNIDQVSKIQRAQELIDFLKANVEKWRKASNFALIFDTKYRHPTGAISSIELKAYVFHYEGEVEFILILRDTTYRDEIASLETANADYRNNVIATFSHELRTPLNSNMGLLESCMDSPDISEDIKSTFIDPALISAKLLLYLVNDILDYSQFLNGKLQLNFTVENLHKTIENCRDLFVDRLKQKNINFILDIDRDVDGPFCTDHGRVTQIILNLLGNALKFTLKGEVTVKLRRDAGEIFKLSVIDTGIGMEKDTQDKLRRNMEKGEFREKINSNTAGMGIGLFISNMLAFNLFPGKNLGLMFESKKDQGTTFSFYIENKKTEYRPIYDPEVPLIQTFPSVGSEAEVEQQVNTVMQQTYHSTFKRADHASIEGVTQAAFRGKCKVLIVDDELMNILVLEAFCKSNNVATERAFHGKEAVEKVLADDSIKLVFTDVNMPIMDGYETAKKLKSLMGNNTINSFPIIGVTAYVAKDKIDKCIECGMTEVHNKPITKQTVSNILKKYGIILNI